MIFQNEIPQGVLRAYQGATLVYEKVTGGTPFIDDAIDATTPLFDWDFQDNTVDRISSVAFTSAPTTYVTGIIPTRQALRFTNQIGEIPNTDGINIAGGWTAKTIMIIIAPTSIKDHCFYEQGGGTRGIEIYSVGNELRVAIWNRAEVQWQAFVVGTTYVIDTYYQLAITYEKGVAIRCIVNGVLANEATDASVALGNHGNHTSNGIEDLFDHSGDISIGESDAFEVDGGTSRNNPNADFYRLTLWNRALTVAELSSIWDARLTEEATAPPPAGTTDQDQFIAPTATNIISGTVTGDHTLIDEDPANDGDFVSLTHPANVVFDIPALEPENLISQRYRFRTQRNGGTPSYFVRLRQGSTVIAEYEEFSPATFFVNRQRILSTAEMESITDYSDLNVQVETYNAGTLEFSWLQFELITN